MVLKLISLMHQVPPPTQGYYGQGRPVYEIFTPLVASIDHIYVVNEKSPWFKRSFKHGLLGNKNEKSYCDFHEDNEIILQTNNI